MRGGVRSCALAARQRARLGGQASSAALHGAAPAAAAAARHCAAHAWSVRPCRWRSCHGGRCPCARVFGAAAAACASPAPVECWKALERPRRQLCNTRRWMRWRGGAMRSCLTEQAAACISGICSPPSPATARPARCAADLPARCSEQCTALALAAAPTLSKTCRLPPATTRRPAALRRPLLAHNSRQDAGPLTPHVRAGARLQRRRCGAQACRPQLRPGRRAAGAAGSAAARGVGSSCCRHP